MQEDVAAGREMEDSLMVVVPADELLATLSMPASRHGHSPLPEIHIGHGSESLESIASQLRLDKVSTQIESHKGTQQQKKFIWMMMIVNKGIEWTNQLHHVVETMN